MTMPFDVQRRALLLKHVDELSAARSHLDFSYARVRELADDLQAVAPEDLERAEAYTSRFSRGVDLLVNKVLRALDTVEMLPPGTLLDVIHRAEKRGLVDSAEILREMKSVRNEIAHDYAGAQLPALFAYCRAQKPVFDAICDRTKAYIARLA